MSPQIHVKAMTTAWAPCAGWRLLPASPCFLACQSHAHQITSLCARATDKPTPASAPWHRQACRKASSSGRSTQADVEGWVRKTDVSVHLTFSTCQVITYRLSAAHPCTSPTVNRWLDSHGWNDALYICNDILYLKISSMLRALDNKSIVINIVVDPVMPPSFTLN